MTKGDDYDLLLRELRTAGLSRQAAVAIAKRFQHLGVVALDTVPTDSDGLPVPTRGDAGKVVTVTSGEDGYELDVPGSGGSSAVTIVQKAVAFGDAGLTTGVHVTTPAADVYVLAVWLQDVGAPFDGTTPKADVGDITQTFGIWGASGSYPDLTLSVNASGGLQGIPPGWDIVSALMQPAPLAGYSPIFKVAAGTDLAVWVTQDGQRGGLDPVATTGAFTVVLVLAAV